MALIGSTSANIVTKYRHEGLDGLLRRAVRRAYQQLDAAALDFGLLAGDVADSTSLSLSSPPPVPADRPIRVGWLCTPPQPGSGGHTTMFRMVQALGQAGHVCTVVLHDRHGGNTSVQAEVIRSAWPWVRTEVRGIAAGLGDLDVVVATGWESAHILASRSAEVVQRAYFIQDYEPMFYPHGTDHALATDSYRFGFSNIALGRMVHERLATLGVPSTQVTFGSDSETYRMVNSSARSGVAFFARPDTPRRGYRLGMLALAEFHRRRPEQTIHVFGAEVGDVGFPITRHGRPTPVQLNELYNQCAAGLTLSFTNVSLVPDEMLAAGCVPVVNDSSDARAVLDNPQVMWARPTPVSLAEALGRVVDEASPARSELAAKSVQGRGWSDTGHEVVTIIENLARANKGEP